MELLVNVYAYVVGGFFFFFYFKMLQTKPNHR